MNAKSIEQGGKKKIGEKIQMGGGWEHTFLYEAKLPSEYQWTKAALWQVEGRGWCLGI